MLTFLVKPFLSLIHFCTRFRDEPDFFDIAYG
jgi:hypothetical protein